MILVRSLNTGGTERQIIDLAKGLKGKGHFITVIVFYPNGSFESELNETGIRILSLDKKSRWDVFGFTIRLFRVLRNENPDIVYSFLVVPNIFLGIMKVFFPAIKMVWGIRASNMDLSQYDWLARFTFKISCWLAYFADIIVVNSNSGMGYHAAKGFPMKKMIVIPNGIDTERFYPDIMERRRVRKQWGVADCVTLIGLVGRLDPMKDHSTFLRAAALLTKTRDHVRFVCVGDGPIEYRQKLYTICKELGLSVHVIWAGARADVPSVYNALDIVTSSSYGEGFPNVIGEAMACGVLCVVTDVGDSASLVGDTSLVVPSKDPAALMRAWSRLLSITAPEFQAISGNMRQRIIETFGIEKMILKTERLFVEQLSIGKRTSQNS